MENISDFEKSCEFCEKNYSNSELYEFLKNGSDMEKQLSALQIETVSTPDEAKILMSNLTGVDGKIREAVSFKLKCFMQDKDTAKIFNKSEFYDIFLDAVIDINGNICRNVISAITNLKDDENFSEYAKSAIIERSFAVLEKIKKFSYKDKKYVKNKELFKLYWYLYALTIFDFDDKNNLLPLLKACSKVDEYTIQEKVDVLKNKYGINL